MKEMTTYERVKRMYEHREADRVPIIDGPWGSTVERWQREGMPKDVSYVDYFGLDKFGGTWADTSPRFESKTIEETDEYRIDKTAWGATMKNWKHSASTPEFLDFTIKSADDWKLVKERLQPSDDRIDWKGLKENYPRMRKEGQWIDGGFWFGFDITHAWAVGTERVLMAMATEPEWIVDMWNTELDLSIALHERIWDAGYKCDAISWPDDMGFKGKTFFSVQMYRDLLKPVQKRAIDWAHAKGIYAHMHTCGNVNAFVPEFIDIGLDALNPLEVKAGMTPVELKQKYGDKLVLHGGINAMLWDKPAEVEAEMRRVVPILKENGGYIFGSDHSVPSSVSLEDFRRIVELAKELGKY